MVRPDSSARLRRAGDGGGGEQGQGQAWRDVGGGTGGAHSYLILYTKIIIKKNYVNITNA